MNGRPEKKRYVIEWTNVNGIFKMTSPTGLLTENTDPRKLSNQAFDSGADEVAHMYDLTVLDRLINSK